MIEEALAVLRITHRFEAAPERVFDAWIDPAIAGKWLFTSPSSEAHSTEIDAGVGGKWTIKDRREGCDYTAIGEYLEIDRPRRLVFSFGMPQFSPEFCRVSVEVAPEGAGCLLTLTQEPLPAAYVSDTEKGWSDMFTQLAVVLTRTRLL